MLLSEKQKHLKLKEMTGGDFSESHLAKFEKGETEITVGKLFTVLENSNVYLDEFQNLYNEYEQSDEYNYRQELAVAYAQKNIKIIKEIQDFWEEKYQQKPDNKIYQINKIVVKINLAMAKGSTVFKEDTDFLMNYLESISEWGRYELWIFGNCLRHFDDNALEYYGMQILGKANYYHSIHLNQQIVIRTFLNLIDTWLRRENLIQAFKYINHLKEIGISINFFYEKILFEYHKAHYKVLQKQNGAIEEMKKHAQTLADYGFPLEAKALFEEIEKL
ncbi:Positive transcriptional regulator MutR family [Lactococcus lactis subsp. lactis]|uniref:HTH-type transcriptional regulator n=2 Tax=Lactococcus lactis TaxID=1358 RepID=A0A2A5SB17_LACLH|nr:transcriptional regulator [Lactococcus lactis]KSU11025.1 Positive transcriptional regulator MutR family [Lactococcus lactis subsp. lactis]PCS10621.1 HTH-type transcriptional regulator [Lactococcus lactis subsp. hordniae]